MAFRFLGCTFIRVESEQNSSHPCAHTRYKLANDGHDTRSLQAYLGHRNIQNTTRYTALAPDRFKTFWRHCS
jgi:site-specific recombinase XerD